MVRTKKQIVDQIIAKKKAADDTSDMYLSTSPQSPLPQESIQPNVSLLVEPLEISQSMSESFQMDPDVWIKVQKLQTTFSNLNLQEINEMLKDCDYNEEQVIFRLISQINYLTSIRHRIETINSPKQIIKKQETKAKTEPKQKAIKKAEKPKEIKEKPKEIKEKPKEIKEKPKEIKEKPKEIKEKPKEPFQKKGIEKPKIHHARLGLDEALKQIEDKDSYEGWSDARLRAFQMIDKNPNSYYYRFNAPGEQQKKGKWSDEENQLFLTRLSELGANSQWGVFSMAIPGRVGYQCSNYYRFLIESGQLHDPNYVLDENGKARYLFDKKSDDGSVEKIFRKHSKHGSSSLSDLNKPSEIKLKKKPKRKQEDEDPTFDIKKKFVDNTKYIPILPAGKRMTRQRYNEALKQDHVVPQ